MSKRLIRSNVVWLALTLAVSFALAACAAGGGPSEPGAPADQTRASEREGAEPRTLPPPATGSESQRMGRERTPLGDTAEIRRPWVQVRAAPNANARAIALVFGNDRLQVMEQQGDWVRVRLNGREGWIPVSATEAP